MKTAALSILLVLICACSQSGVSVSDLRNGDLLFVVSGEGNNITNVTDGVDGLGIDHVAIYSEGKVVEAIPVKGVVEWPLDSFLVRLAVNDAVLVGRVRGLDERVSVENAERFVGLPYDEIFIDRKSVV